MEGSITGAPERARRRVVPPEEERGILRQGLMDRYRADPRYQAIVRQDLAPLWREFESAKGWRDYRYQPVPWPVVVDLWQQMEATDPALAPLRAYVSTIAWTVATTLGLTESAYPSSWALAWVHEDVAGKPREARNGPRSLRARDEELLVSLDFTPNFVGARYYAQDRRDDPYDEERDLSRLGIGYGPNHWAALEETLVGIVVDAVKEMRREIEVRYPWRNPSHLANWPRDLDALHRALFHDVRPFNSAEALRLRRIAEPMGIDPPTRRGAARSLASTISLGEVQDLHDEGAACA